MKTIRIQQENQKSQNSIHLLLFISISGVILRLIHFVYNRSLWGDEAFLCINFLGNQWQNLFHPPLLYSQQAPLGFLLVEKALVTLFGSSEYVLRLFSLLTGVASIFIFLHLSKYYLEGYSRVLALCVFILSYPVIYHSVEAKQYSCELFVSLILYAFYLRYRNADNLAYVFLYGIIGAIAIWFSYSSLFILAAFGGIISIKLIRSQEWKKLFAYFLAFLMWLISFIPNYWFFVKPGSSISWLTGMWEKSFMPISGKLFSWLPLTLISIMKDPMGLTWYQGNTIFLFMGVVIGMTLITLGTLRLFREDKESFFLFVTPLFLALIASSLKVYPFHGRFILFGVPVAMILLGKGMIVVSRIFSRNVIVLYIITVFILIPPLYNTIHHILIPESFPIHADYRRGVSFINQSSHRDSVYIPAVVGMSSVEASFNYYNQAHNYNLKHTSLTATSVTANSREELVAKYSFICSSLKKQKAFWLVTNPIISAKIKYTKPPYPYESETNIILEAIKNIGGKVTKSMEGKTIAAYHIIF